MKMYKILIVVLCSFITMLLLSCTSKGTKNTDSKTKGEELLEQAEKIKINCDSSSVREIETAISLIKAYLIENQNKNNDYSELQNEIEELQRCLDFHNKIKEYTKEYGEFSNKVYNDVNSAMLEQERFLDQLSSSPWKERKQMQSLIANVKKIKDEFTTMKPLFEREFPDLFTYNSEIQNNATQFENSDFKTVRKSWKKIAESKRSQQATIDLTKMVANVESYLKNDAERICMNEYGDEGLEIEGSRSMQTGQQDKDENDKAIVCIEEFIISMKGNWAGLKKLEIRISVKGMVAVTFDENKVESGVAYKIIGFKILRATNKGIVNVPPGNSQPKDEIEKAINSENGNSYVRDFAIGVTSKYFVDEQKGQNHKLIQCFAIFKEVHKDKWHYVNDPYGRDYFAKASETIVNYKTFGKFSGDCDDHAILMAATIKAIGGTVRLVFIKRHVYPELLIEDYDINSINSLVSRLFSEYNPEPIAYHTDEQGRNWINLDYTAFYPGGKFMDGDIIDVLNLDK